MRGFVTEQLAFNQAFRHGAALKPQVLSPAGCVFMDVSGHRHPPHAGAGLARAAGCRRLVIKQTGSSIEMTRCHAGESTPAGLGSRLGQRAYCASELPLLQGEVAFLQRTLLSISDQPIMVENGLSIKR